LQLPQCALKRPFKIFSEMLKSLTFENQTLRAVAATLKTLAFENVYENFMFVLIFSGHG